MGAEWWEYKATFGPGMPDPESVFKRHKAKILAVTPDWPQITISDKPGMFTLSPWPSTKEQLRALYEANFGSPFGPDRNLDAELGPDWEMEDMADDFYDDIPRGQGFYEVTYEGEQPMLVKFCGYSCD